MDVDDYYAPSTTTSTMGNVLGRSGRAMRIVTTQTINPLIAGTTVSAVWGGINAIIYLKRYKQGVVSGQEAVTSTVGESVGMGVAAGVGLLASNAIQLSALAATAPVFIPFTVGVVVTSGVKVMWNCVTKKHLTCPTK